MADEGWREIAEVSPQQQPSPLRKSLRIDHAQKGAGLIVSDPKRQGVALYCDILFDNESMPRVVHWDDEIMWVDLDLDADT